MLFIYCTFSKITTLTNDLDKFKVDYVSLLQSCVRVSLGERHREGTEVKLYGGDTVTFNEFSIYWQIKYIFVEF